MFKTNKKIKNTLEKKKRIKRKKLRKKKNVFIPAATVGIGGFPPPPRAAARVLRFNFILRTVRRYVP